MAKKKSLSKEKTVLKEVRTNMDVILLKPHGIYNPGQKMNVSKTIALKWIEEKKAKRTNQEAKTDTQIVIERIEEENKN